MRLKPWGPEGRGAVACSVLLLFACGKPGNSPTDPTDPGPGPWAFRAALIDLAAIQYITPLGSLNPPQRPIPTDHLYFRVADPDKGESPAAKRTAIFAPADGIVRGVFPGAVGLPDVGVDINVTTTANYRIGHLIPEVPLTSGTRITAGQRLGTTGSVFDIDLSVFDEMVTLGFVNPARVGYAVHTDAPLRHYEEPLRSQLYAKVRRFGAELDGTIAFDVPGRLAGYWYTSDAVPLVFAYDTWDPLTVAIAVNGALLRNGLYTISAGDPLPRDVSVASGLVRYTLVALASRPGGPFPGTGSSGAPITRLLVQMLDDQRVRVEMFALSETANVFTGAAREFAR